MPLVVNELFFSIQGESSFAGLLCFFVRLTGCNLRCSYCDTRYAYEEGEPMSVEDILLAMPPNYTGLVEVTGGTTRSDNETPDWNRGRYIPNTDGIFVSMDVFNDQLGIVFSQAVCGKIST